MIQFGEEDLTSNKIEGVLEIKPDSFELINTTDISKISKNLEYSNRVDRAKDELYTSIQFSTFDTINTLIDSIAHNKEVDEVKNLELLLDRADSLLLNEINILSKLLLKNKDIKTNGSIKNLFNIQEQVTFNQYPDLSKFVNKAGFKLKDVPADGNCFYHAVTDQLNKYLENKLTIKEIREIALKEISNYPERYCEFIDNNTDLELQQYFIQHMQDGYWADDIMIQAVANSLKYTINIYSFNNILIQKKTVEQEKGELNLAYTGVHYLSLDDIKLFDSSGSIQMQALDLSRHKDLKFASKLLNILNKYVCGNNNFSITLINGLSEALKEDQLSESALNTLIIISKKDPFLLFLNIFEHNSGLLDNLIDLSLKISSQAENILNIVKICGEILSKNQLIKLEKIMVRIDEEFIPLIYNIFKKTNKQVILKESIDIIFNNLTEDLISILPSGIEQFQSTALLKLRSEIGIKDKINTIENLPQEGLHKVVLEEVIKSLRVKDISKASIKYLAKYVASNKLALNKEDSEIIFNYQEEIPVEFNELQSALHKDYQCKQTLKQQGISSQLHEKFPNLKITKHLLDNIESLIDGKLFSNNFQKFVIFKCLLGKAANIEEFINFLSIVKQYKYVPDQIFLQCTQINLATIINNLLMKTLSNYIAKLDSRISYLCVQINSNGWKAIDIIKLIQHISMADQKILNKVLQTIYEYKIKVVDRNISGENIEEIVAKYPLEEIEGQIFNIASNKFECKLENKDKIVVEKIIKLNPNLVSKQDEYLELLISIQNAYNSHLNGMLISEWSTQQILKWSLSFKEAHNQPGASYYPTLEKKSDLVNIISILQRANFIDTLAKRGTGYLLRDTQICALLTTLDSKLDKKSKLIQVDTGEGKSTISACLAAIEVLCGNKVDLISSSSVLAQEGYESAKGFFKILGISCDTNFTELAGTIEPAARQKIGYEADIVYGDTVGFQGDYLRNASNCYLGRGDRGFKVVIVDEVDSMMIDDSRSTTRLAITLPLFDYLLPVLSISWKHFQYIVEYNSLNYHQQLEVAEKILSETLKDLLIPKHLRSFATAQVKKWAQSFMTASYDYNLEEDYVINSLSQERKQIQPVDRSSGITRENYYWVDGLHQLLQIKNDCTLKPESMLAFYITNIAYYNKYEHIYGMTGTLGGEGSKNFLQKIYDSELAWIPPHKDKQVIELPGKLLSTKAHWRHAICVKSYQEAYEHKRAVLVVYETIKEAKVFKEALKEFSKGDIKIIDYFRSEAKFYNKEITNIIDSKTIIVATNLAGRGTDIKTSKEVENNGGLHVILAFISKNNRDEEQVKGRTARSGNRGSYQIIALETDYQESLGADGENSAEIINLRRTIRKQQETKKMQEDIGIWAPKLRANDVLYEKFRILYEAIAISCDRSDYKIQSRLKQLQEDFALWLATDQATYSIDVFINAARAKFYGGIVTNPIYVINNCKIVDAQDPEGNQMIQYLAAVRGMDAGPYNLAADYYIAKGWLKVGTRSTAYKQEAIKGLQDAATKAVILIEYLSAMNISIINERNANSELVIQTLGKIEFLKGFIDSCNQSIEIIASCTTKEGVRLIGSKSSKEVFPDIHSEILEESVQIGIDEFFEVEKYKLKDNAHKRRWQRVFVAVCSVVEMVAGAMIAVGSGGALGSLGAILIAEGLMDAYKVAQSIHNHTSINMDSYLTSKAISFAVIGVQAGITAAKEAAAKAAALAAGKEVPKKMIEEKLASQILKEVITQAGVQMATAVAISHVTEWASDQVEKNLLDGIEHKIASQIENSSYGQLSQYRLLLLPKAIQVRTEMMQDIQKILYKAIKEQKHQHIIHELGGGIAKAISTHGVGVGANIARVVHLGHKGVRIVDAISKIEPIIKDLQNDISIIIQGGARKVQPCAGYWGRVTAAEQVAAKELAHNIGSLAKDYMVSLIKGRIVTPLMQPVAEFAVNKAVDEFSILKDKIVKHQHQIVEQKEAAQKQNEALKAAHQEAKNRGGLCKDEMLKCIVQDIKAHNATEGMIKIDTNIIQDLELLRCGVYIFEDNGNPPRVYGEDLPGDRVVIDIKDGKMHVRKEASWVVNDKITAFKNKMLGPSNKAPETKVANDNTRRKAEASNVSKDSAANKAKPIPQNPQNTVGERIIPLFNGIEDLYKDQSTNLKIDPLTQELGSYWTQLAETGASFDTMDTSGSWDNININFGPCGAYANSGAAGVASIDLPLLEAMAVKYGAKVAQGFAKTAFKMGTKAIPILGTALLASDIYDVYKYMMDAPIVDKTKTHERRGDLPGVRARKTAVKENIKAAINTETKDFGTCDQLKAMPIDNLVQLFVDTADKIVPEILNTNPLNKPVLWQTKNVIGILKHKAVHDINKVHQEVCKDTRIKTEVLWRMQDDLKETVPLEERKPGWTKGAIRVDIHTDKVKHPELPNIIYDAKFGTQGITQCELEDIIKHGQPGATIKEVRPSGRGGIKQFYPIGGK